MDEMTPWQVSAEKPEAEIIRKAAAVLRRSGVVAFPTSTLYGLGADAADPRAVQRIFAIKKRSPRQPILLVIQDRTWLQNLVQAIPPAAEKLMHAFWPGGVTLVFRAEPSISPVLTGGTGRIGIRVPRHPVAAAIVTELGKPLTGTSANLSGRPGCADAANLDAEVAASLDGILDAGPLKGGRGSTVVDVTGNASRILREGTVSASQIHSVLGSGI